MIPSDCQEWLDEFKKTILEKSISSIAHSLCMMGICEKDESTYEDETLKWCAENNNYWTILVISAIPNAMKRHIKAYIAKDLKSNHKVLENCGKNFDKDWSKWVLTVL